VIFQGTNTRHAQRDLADFQDVLIVGLVEDVGVVDLDRRRDELLGLFGQLECFGGIVPSPQWVFQPLGSFPRLLGSVYPASQSSNDYVAEPLPV
jgi:hypothetical protein